MKKHISSKLLLISFFFLVFQAQSAVITVNTTADSGPGTFRDAINQANAAFGADQIIFNIPISDPGYNPLTGTFNMSLYSTLPLVTGGYTTFDGDSQTLFTGNTNTHGPEIVFNGSQVLASFLTLVSPDNIVKGFVINGFDNGIVLYNNTATGNQISGNYIGTDHTGTMASANDYGIGISGNASANFITSNLISGNLISGVVISQASSNTIRGNKIGTDTSGTLKIPNNYGIAIDNAPGNLIGGSVTSDRNLISGNLTAGIVINGTLSSANQMIGNYIGTNAMASDSLPNGSGIIIAGSHSNTIGGSTSAYRNVISGNYQGGIILNGSGTRNNTITGNHIGTNAGGNQAISNHTGLILKSQSNSNIIGGVLSGQGNLISGNIEIGIYIESSDSNIIKNNLLGPDITGTSAFMAGDTALQGNGIELNTVSRYNIVGGTGNNERNIISGNRVYGLVYYGNSSFNNTSGNYIGVDISGNNKLPNATGICVDGGSNHNIINHNVLSGNKSYGIFFVTTGTYYNEFKGNKVGTNAAGTDTIPNYIGVIVAAGTKYNTIGGTAPGEANVISGNQYDGIEIADLGTDFNSFTGNLIGTDISGTYALPNYNGIGIATNPRKNEFSHNTISGNLYMGVILFEHADSNVFQNNNIGVASNGISPLGNGGAGIAIIRGSSGNRIGPGNIIACNDTAGIIIDDNNTLGNTITQNAMHQNGMIGIDIFPFGFNINDPSDPDTGPNLLMNYPLILSTGYNPSTQATWITGAMDYNYINPSGIVVEVFKSVPNAYMYGEGAVFLGSTLVDSSGHWQLILTGINPGDTICCTATDIFGNTSEFSYNSGVVTEIPENISINGSIDVYPNPCSDILYIGFTLQEPDIIDISLTGITGKETLIASGNYEQGYNNIHFSRNRLQNIAAGMYLLKVKGRTFSDISKIIITD